MTRLDLLRKELAIVSNLQLMAFDVKEKAVEYYNHEIECIEVHGSANPVYSDRKFHNIDLSANKAE